MKKYTPLENSALWRYCEIAASKFKGHSTGRKINFKCNVCGDGHRKKRGYLVYDVDHELIYYKCFNEGDCDAAGEGKAWHGSKWLKFTDENLYRQWRRECRAFKPSAKPKKKTAEKIAEKKPEPPKAPERKSAVEIEFESFAPMKKCPPQLRGLVAEFCKKRRLPIERVREMRIPTAGKYFGRIAIPSFDENGKVVYFQARTLTNQTPKYLNSVAPRENVLYGVDRVDRKRPVVVCEGPVDSMFVENAVATMGCSYSKEIQTKLDSMDCLYLMDNDHAGHSKSRDLLKSGHKVFLWSKFLKDKGVSDEVKDVNEYVLKTESKRLETKDLRMYFSDSPLAITRLSK